MKLMTCASHGNRLPLAHAAAFHAAALHAAAPRGFHSADDDGLPGAMELAEGTCGIARIGGQAGWTLVSDGM